MNYIEPIIDRLQQLLPGCPEPLLRLHVLLVLTVGDDTTEREVHDAWAVWCEARDPGHRSLIPFDDLTPEVQALDAKYAQAIRLVAQELATKDGS
jgi:hypothetical protein